MSEEQNQGTELEPTEQAPQTEGDRMANALQIFADEKVAEANETVTVPEEQEMQEESAEKTQEDRSEYYAKLVERDREIRQLKSQLKGQGEHPDFKSLAQEDPAKAISELGLTPDQLLDIWASQEAVTETTDEPAQDTQDSVYKQELEALKQELQQIKEERKQNTTQQAVQQELGNINKIVTEDTEGRWDLVKATADEGSYNLVLETAAEMFKLNDELPEYTDVLDAVENHLSEFYGAQYEKLSKINKLQHKHGLGEKTEEPVINEQTRQEMSKSPMPAPTLSATSGADTPVPRGLGEMERFNRALNMLNENGD